MKESRSLRRLLHELFEISVVLKGIYGVLEVLLGFIIVFFSRHIVTWFLLFFVQGELNENPRFWLSNQLLHYLSNNVTPSSELFMGAYFLVNGVVKLILAYGLLKERLWAFPSAIGVLAVFAVYETYRIYHTHSLILAFLIVIDIVTIFLVSDEWRARQKVGNATIQ